MVKEGFLLEHLSGRFQLLLEDAENHFSCLSAELVRFSCLVLLGVLQESSRSVEGGYHQDRGRVARKIVILHCHLNKEEAHLANELDVLALIWAQVLGHLALQFVRIGLIEIVVCYEVYLEVEEAKELSLLLEDIFRRDGFVRDFLGDNLGMKRENVLVF